MFLTMDYGMMPNKPPGINLPQTKDYDTTLTDLAQAAYDKATGNDTYKDNPFLQEEVKTYDPNNVDWSKTRRSQSAIINAMEGTWGPIVATALAPTLLKAAISAPLATLATTIGGSLGGKAVDKASEAITGRDFSTNVAMYSPLTPEMGEILNPGYTAGGIYGNFVRNNLKNRGRYTLNYLNPASYKGHLLDLPSTFAAPFTGNHQHSIMEENLLGIINLFLLMELKRQRTDFKMGQYGQVFPKMKSL